MKKYLMVFLLLSLYEVGFAQKGQQTFGLVAGSEVTSVYTGPFEEQKPVFSYSGGVYYDLNFSRRFGFNIAPGQRISTQDLCFDCFWWSNISTYYIHTIELPVNLTLNLDSKETAKWKTYFSIGYTYSYIFLVRDKNSGDFIDLNSRFFWLNRNDHFINVGFEVRHNFNENYTLAINPFTRIGLKYEVRNPTFGLNLKIGRIL